MIQFADLQNQLSSYLTQEQINYITKAYNIADKAHKGQSRTSGDPYISHPLEVASILAGMHMDYQSIVAAILHDVIEDTQISKDQITDRFGKKVAELVDGVSKLTQIKFENKTDAKAENLRKMMLAMSKDIRVILIKLADRLHNMQNLEVFTPEKQKRIALETIEIYAPIANRLGMNNFKRQFEDLGFSYLYPIRYRVLKTAVQKSRDKRKENIDILKNTLEKQFVKEHIEIKNIISREKHLYSLYKKMQAKDLSLSEIMDIYALRIIVNNTDTCYRIVGIIHNLYKPVHGRFKDYIAIPKANGYQSLHTTVLGPNSIPVEIQIRDEAMEQLSEQGIAAHWLYKSGEEPAVNNKAEIRAREWLKGLLEIQRHAGSSSEFIEHVKVDLYPDEVYVFTPTGDILSLPKDATAVDFAYAVHTDVGNNCIAVKIDRRLVPLSTKLNNGQTIEIITAEGGHPNPAWLSFVITGKARSNIRNWLKMQQIGGARTLGHRLLEKTLSTLSLSIEQISKDNLNRLFAELKIDSIEKLFEEIGIGNQMAPIIARKLIAELPKDEASLVKPLTIQGTEGMVLSYAKCCYPIPGDNILGFLNTGRGLVIHRENCNNVAAAKKSPEKYIFVQWANDINGEFQVEIKIDALNKKGNLAVLANVISDCDTTIENVHVDTRDERHNILIFLIKVRNREHLAKIFRRLRAIESVTKVQRVK